MDSSSPPAPPRGPRFSLWQLAVIVLVAVLGTALVTRVLSGTPAPVSTPQAVALAPSRTFDPPSATPSRTPTTRPSATPSATPTPTATPSPTPTPTPTPITVIDKIQGLGRLETAHYSMQTVIETTSDTPLSLPIPLPPLFTQQKMLLVAGGDVIAGFDLTKIAPKDIHVQGTAVQIILPPAEILTTRIDNRRTYVYLDQKPFYLPNDKTLEGKARQEAEDQLTKYALEHEILSQAEEYGRYRLEAFLRALGFTDVEIRVASPTDNLG